MHRCEHCQGRFGLVSYRRHFRRFCSKRCLSRHRRPVEERARRWCSHLLASVLFRQVEDVR